MRKCGRAINTIRFQIERVRQYIFIMRGNYYACGPGTADQVSIDENNRAKAFHLSNVICERKQHRIQPQGLAHRLVSSRDPIGFARSLQR